MTSRNLLYGLLILSLGVLSGEMHCAIADDPVRASELGLTLGHETTVVSQPLGQDGYPDYIALLNDSQSNGVSKIENAWVLLWPALGKVDGVAESYLKSVEQQLEIVIPRRKTIIEQADLHQINPKSAGGQQQLQQLTEQTSLGWQRPWTRKEAPQLARWIDANEQTLAKIALACERPKAFTPLISSGRDGARLIKIRFPHIQALRPVMQLFSTRAQLRIGEGDMNGAFEDLLTCLRLARHVESGPTLAETLVGYLIRGLAMQVTGSWLSQSDLTAVELAGRRKQIAELLTIPSPVRVINNSERFTYLDTVIALFSDQLSIAKLSATFDEETLTQIVGARGHNAANGFKNQQGMLSSLLLKGADVNKILTQGNQIYDQMAQAFRGENHYVRVTRLGKLHEQMQEDQELGRDSLSLTRAYLFSSQDDFQYLPARLLIGTLAPDYVLVEQMQTRAEAIGALTQAAFALRIHFARTAEVAQCVADMATGQADVPLDPFDGTPVKLAFDARGIVLYSIGNNEIDDSGFTYGEDPMNQQADDIRLILLFAP